MCASTRRHRSWHARIIQATSTNGWHHFLRPTYISYGGAHRLATLVLSCTQWSADVGCGLLTSALACTQCSFDVERVLAESPLVYTQWSADIRHGIHLSSVAYTHQAFNIGCGLLASFVTYTHRFIDVKRGLPTSSVAWTHWSIDGRRGLEASPMAFTHRSAHVGRAYPYRSWLALLSRAILHAMTLFEVYSTHADVHAVKNQKVWNSLPVLLNIHLCSVIYY